MSDLNESVSMWLGTFRREAAKGDIDRTGGADASKWRKAFEEALEKKGQVSRDGMLQ